MVRNYIRITERSSYGDTKLQAAITDVVENGVPVRTAAKKHGVPRGTLQKRIKFGKTSVLSIGRFKTVFSVEQELELKYHILHMESLFYGLTSYDVRKIAYVFAVGNNCAHNFNIEKKVAGRDWFFGFIKRHHLSLRNPEATSMARVAGFRRDKVVRFYTLLKELFDAYHFDADRVYNIDETGVTIVQTPKKIVALKGRKQVGRITSAERGKNITVVGAINALGSFISPMIIFPRVRMNDRLLTGCIFGTLGIANPSGWIDCDIFVKFIHHFISCTKPSKEKPVLIVLDGHASHKSLEVVQLCRDNNIHLLTLPPHTSNKMQPLDLTVYGPFKTYLNQEMDTWMSNHHGMRITDYDLSPIIKTAFLKAAQPLSIQNGFDRSGIFPFNPNLFSDADFAAADMLSVNYEDAGNQQAEAMELEAIEFEATALEATALEVPALEAPALEATALEATALEASELEAVELEALEFGSDIVPAENPILLTDRVPEEAGSDENEGCAEEIGAEEDGPAQNQVGDSVVASTSAAVVKKLSVEEISPIPKSKIAARPQKKRKQEKAEIMTSSPMKLVLEEKMVAKKLKQDKIEEKKAKKAENAKIPKAKKKKDVGVSKTAANKAHTATNQSKPTCALNTDTEDVACALCEELYSETSAEEWITCPGCKKWMHEECTDGTQNVCELCR